MNSFNLEKFKADANDLNIDISNGYMYSYPVFLNHFKDKNKLDREDLIIGSYLAYGWMPKILQFNSKEIEKSVEDLNRAYKAKFPYTGDGKDLKHLKSIQGTKNGSVVGMSKLLHFINPDCFPIYDSRVYEYIYNQKAYSYRINKIESYLDYIKLVNSIIANSEFETDVLIPVNNYISENFGYQVTPVRAVDLIMYSKVSSSSNG